MKALVHAGASASDVGQRLASKLKTYKRARKVNVRQEDGSFLGGNFVVDTKFKLMDSSLVLSKFAMDGDDLDIGNKDMI